MFCTCSEVYVILFDLKGNGTDSITVYTYKCGWKPAKLLFISPTNSTVIGIKESEERIGICIFYQEKREDFLGLNH